MFVGGSRIVVLIPGARSLKEKRSVIRSLEDRIKNSYNVSISEVGCNDQWQRAVLGIVSVGNERRIVQNLIENVLRKIDDIRDVEMIDSSFFLEGIKG